MSNDPIDLLIEQEGLPADYREIVEQYWTPLATKIAREATNRNPLIVGINGAQGSGKSTTCLFLEALLKKRGLRAVTLSIDDFYLTRAERQSLAKDVHPLFATRGVPGTHATSMALEVFENLLAGRSFTLPRFDKARDDRALKQDIITGPVDVLLFEGWCVGAKPQSVEALAEPINQLEREEDPQSIWRGVVNQFLGADYEKLFGLIDLLVMLKVESFDVVLANRTRQEEKLRAKNPDAPHLLDEAGLNRFCDHYERLTRHILKEMPARADVTFSINKQQSPINLPPELT